MTSTRLICHGASCDPSNLEPICVKSLIRSRVGVDADLTPIRWSFHGKPRVGRLGSVSHEAREHPPAVLGRAFYRARPMAARQPRLGSRSGSRRLDAGLAAFSARRWHPYPPPP